MQHGEQKLDQIAESKYDFHFGEYISRGWNIFSEYSGGFIGYTAISVVLVIITAFIPFAGSIANIFLSPALFAGVLIVANKIDNGQAYEFKDFWGGFDYIINLALAKFIGQLVVFIVMIPFLVAALSPLLGHLINGTEPNMLAYLSNFPFWSLLLLIPVIYLSVSFSWAIYFVLFYDMDFWPALMYSRKIIHRNWLMIFLFSIAVGFLSGLGALILGVGLFLTLPAGLCMMYAAFADVTKLDEENDLSLVDELIV